MSVTWLWWHIMGVGMGAECPAIISVVFGLIVD